jgi:hypothetical protein
MTASSKTPTASGISRLLAKAGFERSESSATRIRGWRSYSEGYSVTKWDDYGSVEVTWHRGLLSPSEADQIRAEALRCYAADIEAAGYSVTWKNDRLIVTAKAED